MSNLTLYIGTKNTSSWSLRAWLMMRLTGTDFSTQIIALDQHNTNAEILKISPSGKVPVLKHGKQIIWDTLAIAEYLAELYPQKNLWPKNSGDRAWARSISSEMHVGFSELRNYLPMSIKARHINHSIPQFAANDIKRIVDIWSECRNKFNSSGSFLFGDFTIADAMFAPVATRFITYDVQLPEIAIQYVNNIMKWPGMREWCDAC